jgi:periplasmic mercuric ion binding protein
MKKLFLIVLILSFQHAFAQKSSLKLDTIIIKTSAQCGDCKERIESALNFCKGVKYANLDLENKMATCVYKPKKTTPDKLKHAIAAVGYDADDVKANFEAVLRLPKCCQPGGH